MHGKKVEYYVKNSYKIIHKGKTVQDILEYQKNLFALKWWKTITFWKDKFDDFADEVLNRHQQEIENANVLENINRLVWQTNVAGEIIFYGKLDYEIQDKGKTLKIFETKEND
ncbi:hypothetical protein [Spiroplasma sp. SV19]|uniref:hypothetical protein n=1 Tax=Spiroplasma sp. SV19 TaxID=2570468 RepID=UPI0024B82DBD|nr:hypothetical protein [Spiroplasma sp. SV19]WHQ37181.1 hypothetical protein E7Y35_04735 [Spiroplasma sp. SV19]